MADPVKPVCLKNQISYKNICICAKNELFLIQLDKKINFGDIYI